MANIDSYNTPDDSGAVPNLLLIGTRAINNKTGNVYIITGVGFNTKSQRWEYSYNRECVEPKIVFHREVQEFYQKFSFIGSLYGSSKF